MITITETITGQKVTCEAYDVADTIRAWFADAPVEVADEVNDAITSLESAIQCGEYTGGWATYLAITIETA